MLRRTIWVNTVSSGLDLVNTSSVLQTVAQMTIPRSALLTSARLGAKEAGRWGPSAFSPRLQIDEAPSCKPSGDRQLHRFSIRARSTRMVQFQSPFLRLLKYEAWISSYVP